jgi:hypothetical protein
MKLSFHVWGNYLVSAIGLGRLLVSLDRNPRLKERSYSLTIEAKYRFKRGETSTCSPTGDTRCTSR